MIKQIKWIFSFIIIIPLSFPTFAGDSISIAVKTNEKTAAGIGYSVGGKNLGGAGKSYLGKGPKNKKYSFGYRKGSVSGINVPCGSQTLTKNSSVILVTKGNKCQSIIK